MDGSEGNYLKEICTHENVTTLTARITESLLETEAKCLAYREQFTAFRYLWATDPNIYFSEFLAEAWIHPGLTESKDESEDAPKLKRSLSFMEDTEPSADVETLRYPNLTKFDEKIRHFRNIQNDVADLRHSVDIDFLRINSQPIKQALSTWVTKWVYLFTQYLQDHVTNRLKEFDDFVEQVNKGMNETIPEGKVNSVFLFCSYIKYHYLKLMYRPQREA